MPYPPAGPSAPDWPAPREGASESFIPGTPVAAAGKPQTQLPARPSLCYGGDALSTTVLKSCDQKPVIFLCGIFTENIKGGTPLSFNVAISGD